MRNRIFFKLLLAFLPVILVTMITLDTAVRRAWEGTLRDEIQRSASKAGPSSAAVTKNTARAERKYPVAPITAALARSRRRQNGRCVRTFRRWRRVRPGRG